MHGRVLLVLASVPALWPAPFLEAQIATFSLGKVSAAQGQNGLSVPFTVAVDSETAGGQPLAGLSAAIRYDPAVIGGVTIESAREAVEFEFRDQSLFFPAGLVGFTARYSSAEPAETKPILPAERVVVANLKFCVLGSATPGTYPLKLVDGFRDSGGDPFARTFAETVFGDEYKARIVNGSVTISQAVAAGQECPPDQHLDRFPEVPSGAFRLAAAAGRRGSEVVVPLFMRANTEIAGFRISLDFDEEVLSATSYERVYTLPITPERSAFGFVLNNDNEVPGNSGIEEGFIFGGAIFSLGSEPAYLARDVEHEVVRFKFRIKEEARAGKTEIRFLDGARLPGAPSTYNQMSAYSAQSYTPIQIELGPSIVIIDSTVSIIGDVTVFSRGDSNGDGLLNIADAQATLNFLFLGGTRPPCLDAADADDSGDINLTDPVTTLQFLFLGGVTIPPPFGVPGVDETEDLLEC